MPTNTYLDLLQQAAGELNLVALADTLAAGTPMTQRLLDRLVMMVDSWNLKPTVVPWYDQFVFNLKPGQQSYLIGPNAPDWNAPKPIMLNPDATNLLLVNPVATGVLGGSPGLYPDLMQTNGLPVGAAPYSASINGGYLGSYPISLLVNFTAPGSAFGSTVTPVRLPLAVLTVDQWANISLPYLATTFPSGVYLDFSVITGINASGVAYTASKIWVWGIPTVANQIEFFYWHALTIGNLTDNVNAAPGYFRAMALNLAVEIAPSFGVDVNAITIKNAADALGDIRELNTADMSTRPDRGMPGSKTAGYSTRAQFLSGVF